MQDDRLTVPDFSESAPLYIITFVAHPLALYLAEIVFVAERITPTSPPNFHDGDP